MEHPALIGDIVGTLSVPGFSGVTYSFVNNPNGSFALAGNNLTQANDLPNGVYSVTIKAVATGLNLNQIFTLYNQSVPIIPAIPAGTLFDASSAALKDSAGAYLTST